MCTVSFSLFNTFDLKVIFKITQCTPQQLYMKMLTVTCYSDNLVRVLELDTKGYKLLKDYFFKNFETLSLQA